MLGATFPLLPLLALVPVTFAALLAFAAADSRKAAAGAAAFAALIGCGLVLACAPAVFGGEVLRWRIDWMPQLGLSFGFRMDGLAWMFALLICAIGALIVLYAAYYLDARDPPRRFFAYLLCFMGAMLGIVLADNLILLCVFWELTGVASFLLIGYWHHRQDAREGARMALVVTGGGGLALLGGALLLGHIAGSYELDVVLAAGPQVRADPLYVPALVLVLLGAFTKSAQFPFHFWLPRAMAAPTPVSAYLHSATMVKAGVFLLARLYPVLADSAPWFWLVTLTGLVTLLVGAYVAIFQHDLKGLLAYSTISHLGLITLLFGLDEPLAVVAGVFHILNHATFKASLFMAAGIIDHETGSRDMRRLNGLWQAMPWTGALAMVAAGAMAGVPLANGFLSKEMFFAESLDVDGHQALRIALPVLATFAGILSVAYSVRFIHDVFFNGDPVGLTRTPHEPPRLMRVPVEVLVFVCLVVGFAPALVIGPVLAVAAQAALGQPLPAYELALWHGFNLPLLMSTIAIAGGVALYFGLQRFLNLHRFVHLPRGAYDLALAALAAVVRAAGGVTRATQSGSLQRYLRVLFLMVLVAGCAPFVAAGMLALPELNRASAVPPAAAIVWAIGVAAVIATVLTYRSRMLAVVIMGAVGLAVSVAFAFLSAPDLALTQVLVEMITIVLLMLALNRLPAESPPEGRGRFRRIADGTLAALTGLGAAALAWQVLMRGERSIADYYLETTVPEGGGANAVNVILVDYRGFDTLGEITVLGIAGLIVAMLLRAPAAAAPPAEQPASRSLMLTLVSRALIPLAMLVSVYLFLRGHNEPGGGFIAGLVLAIALILLVVANGVPWVGARMSLEFRPWIAAGLLIAAATGIGSWLFAHPFLTSTYVYMNLPLIGAVPLASAALFDLGVYVTVVGAAMLALVALARADRTAGR